MIFQKSCTDQQGVSAPQKWFHPIMLLLYDLQSDLDQFCRKKCGALKFLLFSTSFISNSACTQFTKILRNMLENFPNKSNYKPFFWPEIQKKKKTFSNFSWMLLNPNFIWIIIVLIYLICETSSYQKLVWPCTVWINCSSDLKNFAISQPSASNFKSFSWSVEQFFLAVGQNNFGNKIP